MSYSARLLVVVALLLGASRVGHAFTSCAAIHDGTTTWKQYCQSLSYNGLCGTRTIDCYCEHEPGAPTFCDCEQINNGPYSPAGTACETDSNPCTADTCTAYGLCTHAAVAANVPCTDDGNPCTSDVCDGASSCTHNNPTGGSVCGASCIAPGTCCNNPNSCTGGRTCSGLGGSCGCPGGTFDCGGACINNATCCASPNTCTGGKVCSGNGGSCSCPAGKYDCGGTCVATGSCCNNPNNCTPPTNGTATCPSPGGTCTTMCNSGYKSCNGACIANSACCADTECPNDAGNHRHGVCAQNACGYACDPGFKACGGTCIPTTGCCGNNECATPPSVCFGNLGTCNNNVCTYPYADGAACNADGDACTPNDSCKSGTCVADTAHLVKCIQRLCHTTPACNKTTGNCDDAAIADGPGKCGGDGCTPLGDCTTGNCSTGAQTTDCSPLTGACVVGVCDPTMPGTGAQKCGTQNVLNGTSCGLTDKCQLQPACSGGTCVGTPKECDPTKECSVAMCNPSTGDCDEAIAPVGSSCGSASACTQNATCDATGNCNGDPVPDGTPCEMMGCDQPAACVSGACVCISSTGTPGDSPDGGANDASVNTTEDDSGCAFGGTPRGTLLSFFVVAAIVLSRRRRRPV